MAASVTVGGVSRAVIPRIVPGLGECSATVT
jgi:hypothetical protein